LQPIPGAVGIPVDASFHEFCSQILIERSRNNGDEEAGPHEDHPWVNYAVAFGYMKNLVSEGEGEREGRAAELNVGPGIVAEHHHDLVLAIEGRFPVFAGERFLRTAAGLFFHVQDDSSFEWLRSSVLLDGSDGALFLRVGGDAGPVDVGEELAGFCVDDFEGVVE
jgi:hypothetical protein